MDQQRDLGAIASAIIDANLYMTLATVDGDGRPWVSPVFYATKDYAEFYWISSPETTHSRNLALHPHVSMVVFDSKVPAYSGQAVYMAATAAQLAGEEVDRGVEVYPGPAERGARAMRPEQLQPPSPYRLYRAVASQHWILCPREAGPCAVHGRAFDHRITVTL
jgi:pyridoxine/pyridoxamine 5'-phosphate oxidase